MFVKDLAQCLTHHQCGTYYYYYCLPPLLLPPLQSNCRPSKAGTRSYSVVESGIEYSGNVC
jgi:hypothetical protein